MDEPLFPSAEETARQQAMWLKQAHELGLGRREAVQCSSRLLRELDGYLARRRNRRYHTDFDDLLGVLLPGLALALELLADEERQLVGPDMQEQWSALHPQLQVLLGELAATFGLPFADRVVRALEQEVERKLERKADERTKLVIEILEWAEKQHWPTFRADTFDIKEGLEAWSFFCGNAQLHQLQILFQTIQLRQRASLGRQRLKQLSHE